MALPTTPPGANPYTAYILVMNESDHGTMDSGVRARIGLLYALTGWSIICVCTYLALVIVESRRKEPRERLWLFRLVDAPGGRHIVTNVKISLVIFTAISELLILGLVSDFSNVIFNDAPSRWTPAWRAFAAVPMTVSGWLISAGVLQSFLLMPDQQFHLLLTPRIANTLFVLISIIITLGMMAVCTVVSVVGVRFSDTIVAFRSLFAGLAAAFDETGVANVQDLLLLKSRLAALDGLRNATFYAAKLQYGFRLTCLIPIILVNLSSLALIRLIRRQLREKERLVELLARDGEQDSIVWNPPTAAAMSEVELSDLLRVCKDKTESAPTCRVKIGPVASMGRSEDLRWIQLLKSAVRDLLVMSASLFFGAMSSAALHIWLLIRSTGDDLCSDAPWAIKELSMLGLEWMYGIAVGVGAPILIYTVLLNMSRAKLDPNIPPHESFANKFLSTTDDPSESSMKVLPPFSSMRPIVVEFDLMEALAGAVPDRGR